MKEAGTYTLKPEAYKLPKDTSFKSVGCLAHAMTDTDASDFVYVLGIGIADVGGTMLRESSVLTYETVYLDAKAAGVDSAEAVFTHDLLE